MQYRPSRCRSEVELDRLPSDWWNNTDNNGVEVGQLAALFYETDEANVLALMILIAAWKSSLGRWQWASPGDGKNYFCNLFNDRNAAPEVQLIDSSFVIAHKTFLPHPIQPDTTK